MRICNPDLPTFRRYDYKSAVIGQKNSGFAAVRHLANKKTTRSSVIAETARVTMVSDGDVSAAAAYFHFIPCQITFSYTAPEITKHDIISKK